MTPHLLLLLSLALAGRSPAPPAPLPPLAVQEHVSQSLGPRLPLAGLEAAPRGAVPFDEARVFLSPTAEELSGGIDLAQKLDKLATRDLSGSWYGGEAAGVSGLGDVVRRFEAVRDDPEKLAAELERLHAEAPNVAREVDWFLPQLLDARALTAGGDWKASRDQADDGLYAASLWKPDRERWCKVWPEFGRGHILKAGQVATLVFPPRAPSTGEPGVRADEPPRQGDELDATAAPKAAARATLARYLGAVHDFAAYPQRRGVSTKYARVSLQGPLAVSESGASVTYRTRNVLTHWLASDFTLTMRERITGDGRFVADSHITDGPFTLMVARTRGWPLFDREGKFVCLLLVSQLATKPGDPDSMLRGSLGNLKAAAEAPR